MSILKLLTVVVQSIILLTALRVGDNEEAALANAGTQGLDTSLDALSAAKGGSSNSSSADVEDAEVTNSTLPLTYELPAFDISMMDSHNSTEDLQRLLSGNSQMAEQLQAALEDQLSKLKGNATNPNNGTTNAKAVDAATIQKVRNQVDAETQKIENLAKSVSAVQQTLFQIQKAKKEGNSRPKSDNEITVKVHVSSRDNGTNKNAAPGKPQGEWFVPITLDDVRNPTPLLFVKPDPAVVLQELQRQAIEAEGLKTLLKRNELNKIVQQNTNLRAVRNAIEEQIDSVQGGIRFNQADEQAAQAMQSLNLAPATSTTTISTK